MLFEPLTVTTNLSPFLSNDIWAGETRKRGKESSPTKSSDRVEPGIGVKRPSSESNSKPEILAEPAEFKTYRISSCIVRLTGNSPFESAISVRVSVLFLRLIRKTVMLSLSALTAKRYLLPRFKIKGLCAPSASTGSIGGSPPVPSPPVG